VIKRALSPVDIYIRIFEFNDEVSASPFVRENEVVAHITQRSFPIINDATN
jgi:hypothetical protein